MAGTRQPIDVVVANGKKHLTQAEIAARRAQEVQTPKPKTVKPPKWLPETLKKDFRAYAKKLVELNIFAELDADTLGRYLIAHQQYLQCTKFASGATMNGNAEAASDWAKLQDTYFKQCRACAGDLGLSVSARCKLVVPIAVQPTEVDPMFGD